MTKSLPVFFYKGQELTLKSKAHKGRLLEEGGSLRLAGRGLNLVIRASEIRDVRLFRLHGLGRVIEIDLGSDKLFVAVTRLMIGQFAIINFFATGKLFEQLNQEII